MTVRRPTNDGSLVVSSLLQHLERVGFDASPRFLGVDDQGRQVTSFIEGDVFVAPDWQERDDDNARAIGLVAGLIKDLHVASADFVAPPGSSPVRPLPLPGTTWSHGDVGYQNVVYRKNRPVALID